MTSIRMTHAQCGMDAEIKRRFIDENHKPSNFNMRRFTDDIKPKTSTKRGDEPFMSQKVS